MGKLWNINVVGRILFVLFLVPCLGLTARPHRFSLALKRAQSAVSQGEPLAAAMHLSQAAEILPFYPGLWEMAGLQALHANQIQMAVQYLEQAQDAGLSIQGRVALGQAYLQSGDWSATARAWQTAVIDCKEHGLTGCPADLQQQLLDLHLALNDYPAALDDLRTMLAEQPDNAGLQRQMGLILATRQPQQAVESLERAADLDPTLASEVAAIRRSIISARIADDPAYTLLNVGRTLAQMEQWQLAAEAFRQASRLRPDYAEAWAYLGEAVQHPPKRDSLPKKLEADQTSSQEDGYTYLQKALSLEPRSLAANMFMALYWKRQERVDLALQSMQAASQIDPTNPTTLVEMGSLLALQGDLQAAHAAYQKAIELAPNDPQYERLLADFSLKYDYHLTEIALPAARQAVILSEQDPANLDVLGQVLIRLGDLVNAQRLLLRAVQLNPDDARARFHLGWLYILTGDTDAARKELDQARTLDQSGEITEQALRLLSNLSP